MTHIMLDSLVTGEEGRKMKLMKFFMSSSMSMEMRMKVKDTPL